MATSTVLLAAAIGAIIGWIAHALFTEPNGPQRERHLVDAYGQGWRACESYLAQRRTVGERAGLQGAPPSEKGDALSAAREPGAA